MSLKELVDSLPDYAKDLRLNLSSLLSDQLLGDARKYGLLLACAHGTGYKPIVEAAEAEVEGKIDPAHANAARAAAAVMAMNNVYYRFVHLASNPVYATRCGEAQDERDRRAGIDKAISNCSAGGQRAERRGCASQPRRWLASTASMPRPSRPRRGSRRMNGRGDGPRRRCSMSCSQAKAGPGRAERV